MPSRRMLLLVALLFLAVVLLRLMPPLNLSDEALDALIAAIHAFVPEQP